MPGTSPGMTAKSRHAPSFSARARRTFAPSAAHAAPALDGASMGWPWALPFAGILLSIAAGPLLFAKFWHAHYGKIAAGWALVTLAAIAVALRRRRRARRFRPRACSPNI